jgi:Cu(I)/Ag(I) efflux system membrane fusion protein
MRTHKKVNEASFKGCLKRWPMVIFIGFGMVFIYSCQSKQANKQQAAGVYYTCPMHHQIHSDKPGKCPICGMTLVKVAPSSNQHVSVDSSLKYLVQPVNEVVVGNYKVISPVRLSLHDTIKVYGHIGFDKSSVNTVSTLVTGRIERLYVKYVYQQIRAGQPLMEIYSPQLLSVQRDLQEAIKDNNTGLITGLKQQLLNLGMSNAGVSKVADSGDIIPYVTIYSPYNGISVGPSVNLSTTSGNTDNMSNMDNNRGNTNGNESEPAILHSGSDLLNIRDGMYVNAGQTVFTIQNIHQTWAILNVFNQDIGKIHTGDEVSLSADADTAKIIYGEISFIPPYRNNGERTTAIRVYMPNIWKTGTLIHGKIVPENKEAGWLVPATSVTRLGMHAIVWVQQADHPDVYEKRDVQTGEEINNQILIVSGIHEGDKIVENAAYMVDSDNFVEP